MVSSRYLVLAILFAIALTAVAQNARGSRAQDIPLVWEPPSFDFPSTAPQATVSKIPAVSKMMITSLRLADIDIILGETSLDSVPARFGRDVGQSRDATEARQWLCFYGMDADEYWALWLESSALGGGRVDGFALERLGNGAQFDPRCRMLRQEDGGFKLPIPLRLDMTEMQVRSLLGEPTQRYGNILAFDHGHQETIRNEPFVVSNIVAVGIQGGVVWAVQVWLVQSLLIAQEATTPKVGQSHTPKPKLPVVDDNACPGRDKMIPNVKVSENNLIYPSWNASGKSIRALKSGEEVTVLGGVNVVREPDIAVIKYVGPDDDSSLKVGDAALSYGIEDSEDGGFVVFWSKGLWFSVWIEEVAWEGECGFTSGFGPSGCTIDITKYGVSEWWVLVKTGSGLTGWVLAEKFNHNKNWSSGFSDLCHFGED